MEEQSGTGKSIWKGSVSEGEGIYMELKEKKAGMANAVKWKGDGAGWCEKVGRNGPHFAL